MSAVVLALLAFIASFLAVCGIYATNREVGRRIIRRIVELVLFPVWVYGRIHTAILIAYIKILCIVADFCNREFHRIRKSTNEKLQGSHTHDQ